MCLNRRTVLYFGLPWGVQAGCLAPGLENPILEAGPNYYIFLYAPYTARTHFGSGGYGTTLGGSGRLPARAWAWARAWAPGPGGWLGYASCLWAWLWVWAWPLGPVLTLLAVVFSAYCVLGLDLLEQLGWSPLESSQRVSFGSGKSR